MEKVLNSIFYIFTFAAMYLQVFFLVVFLERRKNVVIQREDVKLTHYPSVAIIVPCWNEEKTVGGTVESLLGLEYPKDRIHFYLVDDGSTDNTLAAMRKYENNPQVTIIHKENGGKHTHPGEVSIWLQREGREGLTMATFLPNWFLISPSL